MTAFFFNRVKWRTRISRAQHQRLNELFLRSSDFYSGLSVNGKAKVINRVLQFMDHKRFVGQGLEVTFEMKAVISLAAIELTYGFENFLIPHLHTIHVSEDVFYSRLVRSHVKGITFETGKMYLSWKSIQEGIEDKADGLHLALHEMAHALKIDTVKGSPKSDRFPFYLNRWMAYARTRMNAPQRQGFLRAYAWENLHEFLAVCLENFIERPREFYQQEPQLFAHTCYLLNQFPIEPKERLLGPKAMEALSRRTGVDFPTPKEKDYSYHSWHWSLTMLLVSVFFSPIVIALLSWGTELPLGGFWSWILCCMVAWVVFYRHIITQKVLEMRMYLAFIMVGAGPTLYIGALALDRMLPIMHWTETHHIQEAYPLYNSPGVMVSLKDNALHDWDEARTFPVDYYPYLKEDKEAMLEVEFRRGIFGGKRVRSHRLRFSRTFE